MAMTFAFVLKTRFDLVYRPGDLLQPGWLLSLPADTLAVPSTEFHCVDRWMEDRPHDFGWPSAMCDQIVIGGRAAMHAYFGLFLSRPRSPRRMGMESMLAAHVKALSLRVVTVELQAAQPGHRLNNGRDGRWVSSPCRFCFTAPTPDCAGGAAMGGVGDELRPVAPCPGPARP